MDCWPLEILDKGRKGILEDVDRVQKFEERVEKGKDKCVLVSSTKPRDYFSGNSGSKSPIDRLRELVDGDPQVRTVNQDLLRYIFDQQRTWLRNSTGH